MSNHIGQLVITAPTCKIGHQVLERVLESGEDIRVIARDLQRIPEAIRKQVEVIQDHMPTGKSLTVHSRELMRVLVRAP
ncbi:hypothetical protein P4H83_19115 [Paenibacillus favisporus]|uniref:hypothetical protein n=1 Tax=Paenibacillus TaxID=44249 RepID=UPI0011AB8A47|nr:MULTISPECIES: hypothetical protein [Paenibacillus]MEC0176992.1 hypothetical protein [Paenibacillus favisporus]